LLAFRGEPDPLEPGTFASASQIAKVTGIPIKRVSKVIEHCDSLSRSTIVANALQTHSDETAVKRREVKKMRKAAL
jgi:hypothetical protein